METIYGERQLYEVKPYTLSEGRSNGVRCIDVELGELKYTIVVDRGLDIAGAKYNGKQYAFISKNGIVSPMYYNPDAFGWLEGFGGGLLVTCGLSNVGEPCEHNGKKHGLHGRISNIPAEEVDIRQEKQSGEIVITISGMVRETILMGCDYELHRSITSKVGGNSIIVKDRIINCSDTEQPLMLLYHLNLGYPLMSPETKIDIKNTKEIKPFGDVARMALPKWNEFYSPRAGMYEEVFVHVLNKGAKGEFSLTNKESSMKLDVRFSADSLPNVGLWKSLRPDEYAVGVEPCNNNICGVDWESKHGNLRMLKPGEEEHTQIGFVFSDI